MNIVKPPKTSVFLLEKLLIKIPFQMIFRQKGQKINFLVDLLGGNDQKSSSDSIFVTRVPVEGRYTPKTPPFFVKKSIFKHTFSTDIWPKMSKI